MILFTLVVMLISSVVHRRQDVLMEMILFPLNIGGDGAVSPIYSFVVRSDGVLISSYGISRRNIDAARNHNMGFTLISTTVTLSEEELQNISVLLEQIAEAYDPNMWTVMGLQRAVITYDGYIYMRSGACVLSFEFLLDTFLTKSWFRPSFMVF